MNVNDALFCLGYMLAEDELKIQPQSVTSPNQANTQRREQTLKRSYDFNIKDLSDRQILTASAVSLALLPTVLILFHLFINKHSK